MIATAVFLLGIFTYNAEACKIEFKVVEGEKEFYSPGDKLTLEVDVFYTHGNCPEGIKATKFKSSGLKIDAATKWDQESRRTFKRKVKITISKDAEKEAFLSATRTCDKEGGFGEIKFPIK